jgi:hypothetical protein
MDLRTIAGQLDVATVRSFVNAARHVIDAMLIESQRVQSAQTPGAKDYNAAGLSREAPPGGWISHDELRRTSQQMSEAIAAEKWSEGFLFAVQILAAAGGGI